MLFLDLLLVVPWSLHHKDYKQHYLYILTTCVDLSYWWITDLILTLVLNEVSLLLIHPYFKFSKLNLNNHWNKFCMCFETSSY